MTKDVLIVTPTPGTVASSYMQSVLALQAYDREHGSRVAGLSLMHCGAGRLPQTRNMGVRVFLDSDADWLWMVDSDMGFTPDTLDRLLACDKPVIGALCKGLRSAGPDGMFGSVAEEFYTLYGSDDQPVTFFEEGEVLPVMSTGTGCLLVHRDVMKAVGARWFDPVEGPDGELTGEDLAFCTRVRRTARVVPYVHTGVRTSHYQHFWI